MDVNSEQRCNIYGIKYLDCVLMGDTMAIVIHKDLHDLIREDAMEDLWKVRGLCDVADQAEYNRMLKRFRDEEERDNRSNLLYGQASYGRPHRAAEE